MLLTVKRVLFCLSFILVVLSSSGLYGQQEKKKGIDRFDESPVELVEAYMRGYIRPVKKALIGEAEQNPIRLSKLPKAPNIATSLMWRDSSRAAVAIEFSNSKSAEDFYVFVDSIEVGWRISAFRIFELPGVYYMQLNRYRNKGERSIRKEWQEKFDYAKGKGVSEKEIYNAIGDVEAKLFYVFNLRLASSSDRDLMKHFEFLKPKFEKLKNSLSKMPEKATSYNHGSKIGNDLRYLLLKDAYHDEGPLRFEVADVKGMSIGYLYCDKPECVPQLSPGGVIALKQLDKYWYLYRTL